MKKISVIAFLLIGVLSAKAQHQILPFFDDKGAVRIETTELDAAADTLVTVFHRADDIVWSRIVYRVIDMRYKQNYQLYFPVRYDDREYRSLFKVMVDAIVDGRIHRKDRCVACIDVERIVGLALDIGRVGEDGCRERIVEYPSMACAFDTSIVLL